MGGAAGVNLLLSMIRVKFAALLIGITGVGLNTAFVSLQGLIGTIAGVGLQSSGVRDIATAVGRGDQDAIGRTVLTLRRICWLTGLIGMAGMILLSPFLSQITFGNKDYVPDIAALGLIILLGNISGGQMALIQGMRRIGDMARASIYGAALGTLAALGFYITLGIRGIVPTLLAVSVIQLAVSWYYARQVPVPKVSLTLRQTYSEANGMVRMGLVFMFNGLMASALNYSTIALIAQFEGTKAVGLYSAAFALSGLFVNFVLGSMGADYYPRLSAVANDNKAMSRMVNEQTEIGLLLALPGLLATMSLAPWVLQIFYSREFLGAVDLMKWFILGCFGRVLSWPLGYAILALGKGKWFLFTETSSNLIHIALIAVGLQFFGIEGVAVSFFAIYILYTYIVYCVCRHLIKFYWTVSCGRLAIFGVITLSVSFFISRIFSPWVAIIIGLTLTLVVTCVCLRHLVVLLGPEHRVVCEANRHSLIRWILFTRTSSVPPT
jgi:antigen flippase